MTEEEEGIDPAELQQCEYCGRMFKDVSRHLPYCKEKPPEEAEEPKPEKKTPLKKALKKEAKAQLLDEAVDFLWKERDAYMKKRKHRFDEARDERIRAQWREVPKATIKRYKDRLAKQEEEEEQDDDRTA